MRSASTHRVCVCLHFDFQVYFSMYNASFVDCKCGTESRLVLACQSRSIRLVCTTHAQLLGQRIEKSKTGAVILLDFAI
jgi:hypothetical protein